MWKNSGNDKQIRKVLSEIYKYRELQNSRWICHGTVRVKKLVSLQHQINESAVASKVNIAA